MDWVISLAVNLEMTTWLGGWSFTRLLATLLAIYSITGYLFGWLLDCSLHGWSTTHLQLH